jgi:RND family efflux transporter MFP subunit
VGEGSGAGSLRTAGTITYDETRLGDVNVKVPGWIEKLHVDYLGAPVKRGQALFELYSPELYAAQGEYLLAYKASQRAAAGDGKLGGLVSELLDPARTKLSLYDIGSGQIKALETRGKPFKTMTVTSPKSGVVIEKQAFEGMKVAPGMTAFRIADLSRVWVMATVYEHQSQQIEVGQKATMTLSYQPGKELEGKVVFIYPFLDQSTRQLNVRLEFDNPDLELKPGMFSTVTFQGVESQKRVVVSRSAVIDTGERQIAFVARGQGRFEPRQVSMGAELDDGKVEILEGLKAGELVVVSGQFLIDSEARMREALARMMKGTSAEEATAPKPPPVEAASGVALPEAANTALAAVLDGYLAIGEALAADTTTDIGVSARKVADAIDALVAMSVPEQPHFWHEHKEVTTVKDKAKELFAVKSLDDARRTFVPLSVALSALLKATGVPKGYDKKLQDTHCPMYPDGSDAGAVWIQPEGAVRNPYFGSAMLSRADWQRPLQATPWALA